MVADRVGILLDLLVLGIGLMAGVAITVLVQISRKPFVAEKDVPKQSLFSWGRLPWNSEPEPPPGQVVHPLPRTRGPWRRQRKDLQAEHNSKQRERDSRMPHA